MMPHGLVFEAWSTYFAWEIFFRSVGCFLASYWTKERWPTSVLFFYCCHVWRTDGKWAHRGDAAESISRDLVIPSHALSLSLSFSPTVLLIPEQLLASEANNQSVSLLSLCLHNVCFCLPESHWISQLLGFKKEEDPLSTLFLLFSICYYRCTCLNRGLAVSSLLSTRNLAL